MVLVLRRGGKNVPRRKIETIRKIVAQAKRDKEANPALRARFQRNYIQEITSPPYNLRLADLKAAYDDPELNPGPPHIGITLSG